MRYIWIFMLIIAELIWAIYSIKDFIYCTKRFHNPIEHIEEYTAVFIFVHSVFLFMISLGYWLNIQIGK